MELFALFPEEGGTTKPLRKEYYNFRLLVITAFSPQSKRKGLEEIPATAFRISPLALTAPSLDFFTLSD